MGRRAQGGSRRSSQESWRGRVARPSETRQARHGPDLHRDGTRRGRISHRRRHGTHSRRDAAISGAATVWPWSGGRRGPHRAGVRARIRRDAVESAIRDAAAGRITAAARLPGWRGRRVAHPVPYTSWRARLVSPAPPWGGRGWGGGGGFGGFGGGGFGGGGGGFGGFGGGGGFSGGGAGGRF